MSWNQAQGAENCSGAFKSDLQELWRERKALCSLSRQATKFVSPALHARVVEQMSKKRNIISYVLFLGDFLEDSAGNPEEASRYFEMDMENSFTTGRNEQNSLSLSHAKKITHLTMFEFGLSSAYYLLFS